MCIYLSIFIQLRKLGFLKLYLERSVSFNSKFDTNQLCAMSSRLGGGGGPRKMCQMPIHPVLVHRRNVKHLS